LEETESDVTTSKSQEEETPKSKKVGTDSESSETDGETKEEIGKKNSGIPKSGNLKGESRKRELRLPKKTIERESSERKRALTWAHKGNKKEPKANTSSEHDKMEKAPSISSEDE